MLRIIVSVVLVSAMLSACSLIPKPTTQGENNSGYTYVPIDPFPVTPIFDRTSCSKPTSHTGVLDLLPDNAVRAQVEEIDLSGSVTFGPSKVAAQNKTYRVTIDYINADTVNVTFWINKSMRIAGDPANGTQYVDLYAPPPSNLIPGTESYSIYTEKPSDSVIAANNLQAVNIPLYVGVGLRITANIQAVSGNANVSGIGVIGAEADTNQVRGTLVVQTLGINGKSIAAALPIQSELNSTTAQNAVVAVGSIKALLYSPDTITSPRIVGLYLPFLGGQTLVNALVSAISNNTTQWHPECAASPAQTQTSNASPPPSGSGATAGGAANPGSTEVSGSKPTTTSPPTTVSPKQPAQAKGAKAPPKKEDAIASKPLNVTPRP